MKILVSGLVNIETTVPVEGFPVPYFPICYPYFGVNTQVSGVGFNICKALKTLGDVVCLTSMTGPDFPGDYIRRELEAISVSAEHVLPSLGQTPNSVVLYDPEGKRQIYCDLKDIQETAYSFDPTLLEGVDLVAACNINFNRPLLQLAKAAGKPIATDVHVLSDIHDAYNRDFLECADIVFLSDEGIPGDYRAFLTVLAQAYPCRIIVLGRGEKGAAMYLRDSGRILEAPCVHTGPVVNTVGAGDALFSAFVHFTAKGCPPEEALYLAQIFASHKIAVPGGANGFRSEEDILNWARSH